MDTLPELLARAIRLAVGLIAALMLWALPPADGALLLHQPILIGVLAAPLLCAGALLLLSARQQARWDGVLQPRRSA